MSKQGRHPNQILILVKVTFTIAGPQYAYRAFVGGKDAQSIAVSSGDQVGWSVTVQTGEDLSTPPYEITFHDPSIFGVDMISVPAGGPSGFLTVEALSTGPKKYSLSVTGISPISDPQIQVDPNALLDFSVLSNIQYYVRWTAETNVMEYEVDGTWTRFPTAGLAIKLGDQVQFSAILTTRDDFFILFPVSLNPKIAWPSPFSLTTNRFNAVDTGSTEHTDNLRVYDSSDGSKTRFYFVAALTNGNTNSDPYFFYFA